MDTLKNVAINSELVGFEHMADNTAVLHHIQSLKQQGNNGWSKSRNMQKIGVIPALEYVKLCKINPELKDPKKLEKFLMSEAGAAWRVAEDSPFRSANIIIK
jgi:hypothetical protein